MEIQHKTLVLRIGHNTTEHLRASAVKDWASKNLLDCHSKQLDH